jgi:hypothetical protein
MSYFSGDDLVFYKEGEQIKSGGYLIDSILLKEGIAPMTTVNHDQSGAGHVKNLENVSDIFSNLAVPAGLFYMPHTSKYNEYDYNKVEEHFALSDDIYDRLFEMISVSDKKRKTQTNTKKQKVDTKNKNNKKTTKKMKM